MKPFFKDKALGFYFLAASMVLQVVSTISYVSWGTAHYAMNTLVVIALAAGLAVNALLLFIDSDYLLIMLTALYSVGAIQLVADNAGSFADAYQGIVMFGDPTQVGTIIRMAILIGCGVIFVISASFMDRRKRMAAI